MRRPSFMVLDDLGEGFFEAGCVVSLEACGCGFEGDVENLKYLFAVVCGDVEHALQFLYTCISFAVTHAKLFEEMLHESIECICKLRGGDKGGLCVCGGAGFEYCVSEGGGLHVKRID